MIRGSREMKIWELIREIIVAAIFVGVAALTVYFLVLFIAIPFAVFFPQGNLGPLLILFGIGDILVRILWSIVIGFIAGVIARIVMPGPKTWKGFIFTTLLGSAGAFLVIFIGLAVGWYSWAKDPPIFSPTVGAFVVLFIWGRFAFVGKIRDHGI
jgi:uncharacterized membrane protein YeaQ/YmgE (transglycosylase-associated protein family)